jgi:predicted metal-dependent phosphoesterase TrpH
LIEGVIKRNFNMNVSTTGINLSAGSPVDLHMHTIWSDGLWSLEALLDYLLRKHFGLVAITDHDRVDKIAAIQQQALDRHLPVLVAVEMSAAWKGEMTDLLCYGFDPDHNALSDLANDLLRRQEQNTREVYETLQRQGYALSPDALPAILAKPSSQQPDAFVTQLKEHGYGLGEPSAGKLAMGAGCTYATNDPAVIADATHRSGGICLLAHPGRKDGFITYDVRLLDEFRQEVPIDGLEVYYPVHTPAQTAMYRKYAQRHHLLTSAGSDSHGPGNPPIQYRADLSRSLLERVGVQIRSTPLW